MKLKGVWRDLLKFLFAKLREEIYFRLSTDTLCIDPVSDKLWSSLLKLLKAFISKTFERISILFISCFFIYNKIIASFEYPQICKSSYENIN